MRCRLRSILVTSSVKGEGKSVTSINLASTLARSGRRVLLIDADLRAPSLHRHLTLQSEAGLTTVLLGEAALDDVVQPVELRSEEHTSELQSRGHLVCRLLLEKKKNTKIVDK